MRSVAKHSYIKGSKGKARARAHVNYIQYRRGQDRVDGKPRAFFSADRDDISGREVKDDIANIGRAPVVCHKLILSPGVDGVDMKAYTREVLEQAGRHKGLDLDWRAVIHGNTDHVHSHVVVFGKDKNGRQVKFSKDDYKNMRQAGDRYLEREHFYERYLTKTRIEERAKGDNVFESLVKDLNRDDEEKRKRDEKAFRDLDEHRRLDKDLNKKWEPEHDRRQSKGWKQRMYEQRGKYDAEHGHYNYMMQKQRLEDMKEKYPEKAQEFDRQLVDLEKFNSEQWKESRGWKDFDKLLGDNWKSIDKESKERSQDKHDKGRDRQESRQQGRKQKDTETRQFTDAMAREELEQSSGDQADKAKEQTRDLNRDNDMERGGK